MKQRPSVSLCIPACGRPERLRELLSSLVNEEAIFVEKIVVDATPDSAPARVHQAYKEVRKQFNYSLVRLPGAGPAEARAEGARRADAGCQYVLFLDEDLRSRPGNAAKMREFLETTPSVACCSAQWIDRRPGQPVKRRPLGHVYINSLTHTPPIVYKRAVHTRPEETPPLTLHELQASIMIRRQILDKFTFDRNFDFFLELFDFFYALRISGLTCAGLPEVIFDHYMGQYESASQKHDADLKRKAAEQYFLDKWGVLPAVLRKGGPDE